jgi:protein phosphatase
MDCFGKTDIGRRRKNNQDTFRILKRDNLIIAVVCDGMGGAAGGGVASNIAADTFISSIKILLNTVELEELDDNQRVDLLVRAGRDANIAVYKDANEYADLEGMGTTLVACMVYDEKLYIVNAGDSRLYVSKGRGNSAKLFQITKDHSLVQELFEQGRITAAEVQSHPYKNYILRALGIEEEISFDYFIVEDDFDVVLLCSDGLTNFVSETEMMKTLSSVMSASEKVELLVESANENGGGDNITAVVLQ